jgi:DNA invertase Pin-like site-specific DNA recombinase
MLVGYARVTDDPMDQAEQKVRLDQLGVVMAVLDPDTHGGGRLGSALDRCSVDDVLVVTSPIRLAGSARELSRILSNMTERGVALQIGADRYDLTRPNRSLTDTVRLMATLEGEIAERRLDQERTASRAATGRRRGRRPKLLPAQERELVRLYEQGVRTVDQLAEDYDIGTSTVYRVLDRSTTAGAPAVVSPEEASRADRR